MKKFCIKLYACVCKSSSEIVSGGKEIVILALTEKDMHQGQGRRLGFIFNKMLSQGYRHCSQEYSPKVGILFVFSITGLPLILTYLSLYLGF